MTCMLPRWYFIRKSWNGTAVAGIINWRTASGLDGQSVKRGSPVCFFRWVCVQSSPLVNDIWNSFHWCDWWYRWRKPSLTNSDIGADEFTPLWCQCGECWQFLSLVQVNVEIPLPESWSWLKILVSYHNPSFDIKASSFQELWPPHFLKRMSIQRSEYTRYSTLYSNYRHLCRVAP